MNADDAKLTVPLPASPPSDERATVPLPGPDASTVPPETPAAFGRFVVRGWLGAGRVEAAQVGVRPGTAIEEHVHAAVRYGDALVNFYHGFHQAGRMDRQELRLVFERGDVTLFDWVPTRARIHALADERQTRELCDLFPGARLDVTASYGGNDRACRGRGKAMDASQVMDLSFGDGQEKSPLYSQLLRAMMADQVAWIRDRTHQRVVTEANGRDSLATACAADALARRAGADR